LFVFKTPVTEIQLSVTLNFNFKFVKAGSDEADYSLHDLSLRCEPLETDYDDYMTYYQNMEYQNELPSFEEFFKKAHYHSDLVFAGYQTKPAFLRDFEQKFVTVMPANKSKLYTAGSSKSWKKTHTFKKGRAWSSRCDYRQRFRTLWENPLRRAPTRQPPACNRAGNRANNRA
jgi:hypothetical protein